MTLTGRLVRNKIIVHSHVHNKYKQQRRGSQSLMYRMGNDQDCPTEHFTKLVMNVCLGDTVFLHVAVVCGTRSNAFSRSRKVKNVLIISSIKDLPKKQKEICNFMDTGQLQI